MKSPTALVQDPQSMSTPLGVKPERIDSHGRQIALHVGGPQGQPNPGTTPLLLVHSINATASVIEMHALFRRQAQRRPVVALDLPGFGASDRAPGRYTPALMVRAIQDALESMRRRFGPAPVDVVALSLGCEFAALAALAEPAAVRSLTLISPTGMERRRIGEAYEDGRTRELRLLSAMLHLPGVGRGSYVALTTRPSMKWFLSRSWGTRHFDPALLAHGHANARVPDAHHAPLDFLSGALFTRGAVDCYRRLSLPVLVAHGQRGSFTDFEAYGHVAAHSPGQWQRRVFATGSMPHLEWAADFDAAYQSWLTTHVLPSPTQGSKRFGTPFVVGARSDTAAAGAGHELGVGRAARVGPPLAGAS